MLTFDVDGRAITVRPRTLVICGWTGRDPAAVEHHIEELAAIGVARPSSVPLYYRVAASQLTQAETIQTVGEETSGEAEPVLVQTPEGLLMTVGSDHTDRALEAHSVALSKQIAAKPVASTAWRLDGVGASDDLALRAFVSDDGADWSPYQNGTLAGILPLPKLVEGVRRTLGGLDDGTVIFCGTVPTLGGVKASPHFRAELAAPDGRTLSLRYTTSVLPIVA
ncbi:MAG: DUF2848 family protein [Pseudomonadota bacterium]